SDADLDLGDVFAAAHLQHTVSSVAEASPSSDTETETSVLDLGLLGDLVDLDIGSGHPLVYFDLDQGTNSVVFMPQVGSVLDVEVLEDYILVIEIKDEYGRWVRYEGTDERPFEDGLVRLDLLGLLSVDGQVTLEDLPPGEYRATLVPDPLIEL